MAHNTGGRPARWGPRQPSRVHWPVTVRTALEQAAQTSGLSLSEYVVRELARSHDVPLAQPTPPGQDPLPIGA